MVNLRSFTSSDKVAMDVLFINVRISSSKILFFLNKKNVEAQSKTGTVSLRRCAG